MPLTVKQFRALTWQEVYSYGDTNKGFKVFGCDLKGVSIVHDYAKGKKTKISYRVAGRSTDSPAQCVKWFNSYQKNAVERSGAQITGSP